MNRFSVSIFKSGFSNDVCKYCKCTKNEKIYVFDKNAISKEVLVRGYRQQ